MPIAKEQIRQIIMQNDISSVEDVYAFMKEGFKDILQEIFEAEMDANLGYPKNYKGDIKSTNKRNGHTPKTLRAASGNSLLTSRGTGRENSSRS